jgi:hypothetical protein
MTDIQIRSSKKTFIILLILTSLLLSITGWVGYLFFEGGAGLGHFLILCMVTIYTLGLTLIRFSNRLSINNNNLYMSWPFGISKKIELDNLASADRFKLHSFSVIGYYWVLKLHDKNDNFIRILPSDYAREDIEYLMSKLVPYLRPKHVEKNFLDLNFYKSAPPYVPWPPFLRTVWRSFLYVILPAFVLTALLLLYTIATNQLSLN